MTPTRSVTYPGSQPAAAPDSSMPVFDFSQTLERARQADKPQPSLAQQLADVLIEIPADASDDRSAAIALIVDADTLTKRLDHFLAEQRKKKIQRTREKRDDLVARCRAAEKEKTEKYVAAAYIGQNINSARAVGSKLFALQQRLAEFGARPVYQTSTEQETWNAGKAQAQAELGTEQKRILELEAEHRLAWDVHRQAEEKWAELHEQFRQADSKLNELTKQN